MKSAGAFFEPETESTEFGLVLYRIVWKWLRIFRSPKIIWFGLLSTRFEFPQASPGKKYTAHGLSWEKGAEDSPNSNIWENLQR